MFGLKKIRTRFLLLIAASLCFGPQLIAQTLEIGGYGRTIILRNQARLDFYLEDKSVKLGNQIYLRVLKNRAQLQLWVKQKEKFKFIRNYKICGSVKNIPDGIYFIEPKNLKLGEKKFVSIGTSFPNAYNMQRKQTGVMFVSARCANGPSIGLTDQDSEELFTILYRAFKSGQKSVDLHIYPSELNPLSGFSAPKGPNKSLILQLSKIYVYFESNRQIPKTLISKYGYSISKTK